MLHEYIESSYAWQARREEMLVRVRRMKPSLPGWYLSELAACASACGVDEDTLLYAQCEGDILSVGGCTTFVAFGSATRSGRMEIGRNFDYWGLDSTRECAVVLAVVPRREDGYAFVSIGWAGILGGWTFVNEKKLFVANNLGGGFEVNPKGIPTLILERMIAQTCGTVQEAIELIRRTPRMRGQVLVLGQPGDRDTGSSPNAVVVSYDAVHVRVTPHTDGFVFDSSTGADAQAVRGILRRLFRRPTTAICSAGTEITLHSVAIWPEESRMWVAHGRSASAHRGKYVRYDLAMLLRR